MRDFFEVMRRADDQPVRWDNVRESWVDKAAETVAAPEELAFDGYLANGEKNWIVHASATSNDTAYTSGQLYGMYGDQTTPANQYGSQAGEAWAAGFTGSMDVAVGVIDTGVDYTHQDLYLNIYLNQGEIASSLRRSLTDTDGDLLITFRDLNQSANAAFVTDLNANGRIDGGDLLSDTRWENGTDQDGNGYVDDLIGWDFVYNDNDPSDVYGHGTHVAGTIGAIGGNGLGVVGVNWDVQIVPLKFLGDNGSGNTADAIEAVTYYTGQATRNPSVDFVATNNSWGGGGFSQSLLNAIVQGAQNDILFIAAAGNESSNNDAIARYPTGYSTLAGAGYEAVISVASITSTGTLSSFSNYGATTVDIGAPGSSVRSTTPNNSYANYSGTSMASPHVAGAAALYAAANPDATAAEIRAAILGSAIATPSLNGRVATNGRLDIAALLGNEGPPPGLDVVGTTGNDTLTGDVTNDRLNGLAGNDTLDGKAGADEMIGGAGNDIIHVDNVGDVVTELAGGGFDTVRTTLASYTLGDQVERLTFETAAGAASGTGNALGNILNGNASNNTLVGLGGNDTLNGSGGVDTLVGGLGKDTLIGGSGNDVFDFNAVAELGLGANRDQVSDFASGDKIDLSTIDAVTGGGDNAFAFIGSASFSGVAGQLRAVLSGGSTIVSGDVNGDSVADFELLLSSYTTPLQPADIIL